MTIVALHPAEGLLEEFERALGGKAGCTVEVYLRILRQLTAWIAAHPGNGSHFRPEHVTRTALEAYLAHLEAEGYSVSHRARVKSAASGFARWLIEEKEVLRRNPARGVDIPAQQLLAPRRLSPDQRYVLRTLVGGGGLLPGPCHQERDAGDRDDGPLHPGQPGGCARQAAPRHRLTLIH